MLNLNEVLAELRRMTGGELRDRYAELFGEVTRAGNRTWLIRRIAWRLQERAEGGLSQRARQRAAELVDEADLRVTAPIRDKPVRVEKKEIVHRDPRLPAAGTNLVRVYKGRELVVQVLEAGFGFEGEVYKSLSAVAKQITGAHCNGFLFFRLGEECS